jgi:hypothetical protein
MSPEGGPTGKGGDLGASTTVLSSTGVGIDVDGLFGSVSGSVESRAAIRGSETGGVGRRIPGSPLVESSMNGADEEGPLSAREAYDPVEILSR